MHIPFAQEQDELRLGKIRVDQGQGNAVKGQIPGRIPGVFPFVGHGDNVFVVEMVPVVVARPLALARGRRASRVTGEPALHVEVIKLLAPQQPCQSLAHDILGIVGEPRRDDGGVELVGLAAALRQEGVKRPAKRLTAGERIA
jgi:hypothetical protein